MSSPAKLTDTQRAILFEASQRKDRCLIPPKTLKGAATQKVAAKLLKAGLVSEIKARSGMEIWRRDEETGQAYSLKLTVAGLKAIPADERGSQSIPSTAVSPNTNDDLSKAKDRSKYGGGPERNGRAKTSSASVRGRLLGRVRTGVTQRAIRHQRLEQPRGLQKIDEERQLPERRKRRFMIKLDPNRTGETVDHDAHARGVGFNRRLFTRRVSPKAREILSHAYENE